MVRCICATHGAHAYATYQHLARNMYVYYAMSCPRTYRLHTSASILIIKNGTPYAYIYISATCVSTHAYHQTCILAIPHYQLRNVY